MSKANENILSKWLSYVKLKQRSFLGIPCNELVLLKEEAEMHLSEYKKLYQDQKSNIDEILQRLNNTEASENEKLMFQNLLREKNLKPVLKISKNV